jgi:5-methylcytosine-specific restriction endonuclease McrA
MIPRMARAVKIGRRKWVEPKAKLATNKRDHSYGEAFVANAKVTKKRDGHRCTGCGWVPPKKFRWLLHVHHQLPVMKGGRDSLSNLKTKCVQCHVAEHPNNKGFRLAMTKQLKLVKRLKNSVGG